jgi:uncharacterized protein (TIGR03118 family)
MRRSTLATFALATAFAFNLGATAKVNAGGYVTTDLVTDLPTLTDKNGIVHTGKVHDPNLVNPWGIAKSPTSPFWIADNNAGVSTLYNVPGGTPNSVTINPRVVSIPTPVDPLGRSGTSTGAVFNITISSGSTPGFFISGVRADGTAISAPATFLFATEDGTIVGWNPTVNPIGFDPAKAGNYGIIAIDNSGNNFTPNDNPKTGAVYKGLAIAKDANGNAHLYVTNFRSGTVEMYNDLFHAVSSPPDFTDPGHLPNSYAPFNVAVIGGAIFVTYAVQDAAKHDDVAGQGHGIVNVFELDGTFRQRFAQHGQLDSPWGMAFTPPDFGQLGGTLWIGNFGNGHINAYNVDSGEFIDKVRDPEGKAILIDGLWTITFGNGGNGGGVDTLYFTAGTNDETHGLFGSLNPRN